jgi:hypothetical protein
MIISLLLGGSKSNNPCCNCNGLDSTGGCLLNPIGADTGLVIKACGV